MVWTKVPLYLEVPPGCVPPAPDCTFGFIASHASSLDGNTTRGGEGEGNPGGGAPGEGAPTPLDEAAAAYAAAAALPVWELQAEHEAAWARLTCVYTPVPPAVHPSPTFRAFSLWRLWPATGGAGEKNG